MTLFRSLLIWPVFAAVCCGQTLTVLRETGPRASSLNIVFLAEGYTASQSAQFQTDAAAKLDAMLASDSWARFAPYVNAFAIFVESAESGADDPSTNTVRNTYFDSTFGYSGIDRLLVLGTGGSLKVYSLLTRLVPEYDIVAVIVNSSKYGGSGGSIALTSVNRSSTDILLHELGHSFAALGDEYVDDAAAKVYPDVEYPNATRQTTRDRIPWARFIPATAAIPATSAPDENTVNLFLGANYRATGYYRPTYNSAMRALGRPFGPVNLREYAKELHRLNLNQATAAPQITQPPASVIVKDGQACALNVGVTGVGPFTYQWALDGWYLPSGSAATFTIPAVYGSQCGQYTVEVTNAAGTVVSDAATVTLASAASAPVIQPLASTVSAELGTSFELKASITGTPPYSIQWYRDGVAIPGATQPTLQIASVSPTDAGSYTVVVTNALKSVTSTATVLTVTTANPPRISNLAIRARVGTDGQPLFVGFVVGSGDGAKPLLIRGVGPSLGSFGVTGAMSDPKLMVSDSDGRKIAENDDWATAANIDAVARAVGAFALSGPTSKDAALSFSADAGRGYTVQLSDVNAATGIVLAEIYDATAGAFSLSTPRLRNVSARLFCGSGNDVAIVGFAVSGAGSKRVLIRAIGPSLAPFGVSGALANPTLDLYGGNQKLDRNDDWSGTEPLTLAMQSAGAFALSPQSRDAALVADLSAGSYSAVVSGVGETTGVVLVELYEVP